MPKCNSRLAIHSRPNSLSLHSFWISLVLSLPRLRLWRETIISPDLYTVLLAAGEPASPLMQIPHFNKNCVFWDVAHVFLLGVMRDLLGSVLVLWAETGALQAWIRKTYGVNLSKTRAGSDEGFKYLWAHCKRWCARHNMPCRGRSPFVLAKMSRMSMKDWPKLPNCVKAMHVKNMLYWLADLAPQVESYNEYDAASSSIVEACLWSAATWFHTILSAQSKMWLDRKEFDTARFAGQVFLKSYQWLSCFFQAVFLFKVRPKWHYLAHIMDDTSTMNPVSYMCLDMESFLGIIKKIGKGTHARNILYRTVQRYTAFLQTRWANR